MAASQEKLQPAAAAMTESVCFACCQWLLMLWNVNAQQEGQVKQPTQNTHTGGVTGGHALVDAELAKYQFHYVTLSGDPCAASW